MILEGKELLVLANYTRKGLDHCVVFELNLIVSTN